MSDELIGIILGVIALASLVVALHRNTRDDITDLRKQVGQLAERTAGLEAKRDDEELLEKIRREVNITGAIREDE